MNSGVNNKLRSGYRVLVSLAVCLVSLAVGCEKTFEMDLPLAVTANKLKLTKDAGLTHILVYATGKWSATLTEDVRWASINKLSGEGDADIVFAYAANYGVSRKVGVVFVSGDLRDTVMLTQETAVIEPAVNFTDRSATLLSAASTIRIPLTTNVPHNVGDMKTVVTYEGEDEDVRAADKGWISDITIDANSLTFSASSYTGDLPRIGYIILSLTDAEENLTTTKLTVTQTKNRPLMSFDTAEESYKGLGATYTLPIETNLYSYRDQLEISISTSTPVEDGAWVKNTMLTSDGYKFTLESNENALRTARMELTFTDSDGNTVSATHTISQRVVDLYEDLRALIPGASGSAVIADNLAIQSLVISDPASANICLSPQTAQFKFDFDENYKTAYVQSLTGKYGFCLKFASAADNTLKRFSKVRLSLKGLTLVKEASPTRYTLKGLTAANVLEAEEPNQTLVPVKNKTIAQLTDEDLYTWVSLQEMEIVFKDGSYTNLTDGYSIKTSFNPMGTATDPRWDTAPLLLTDSHGGTISMLTNAMVPWRRDGTGVPQGAGTFNGVVVAEELVRFGDLGRYQIRAMTRDDIAMGTTPFSKTIVEWNWNDTKNDIIPEVGAGTLVYNGAVATMTSDYNNVQAADTNKGLLPNSAIYLAKKWWNFGSNSGEYFDMKFSTAGLSGSNLTVGFTWGHGNGGNTTLDAPARWKMLYSTDGGETFSPVVGAGSIQNRSIAWWTTTSQDSCPGYNDFLYRLPQSCLGQPEVIVRVEVADTTTDISPATSANTYLTNLGIGKGTLTDKSTQIRIGAITVRYN